MSRRELIRNAAIAGGVAWTAPTIIQSLTSPAAAASGGMLACSYAMIVFTYNGQTYVMKADSGCTGTNATSHDQTFSTSCNGHTYDNTTSPFTISRDGTAITPYPGSPACSSLFTISGNTITAGVGVNIIFALVHNGTIGDCYTANNGGSPAPHFGWICPAPGGTSSVTFCCGT